MSGLSFNLQIVWMSLASLLAGAVVYFLTWVGRAHWMHLLIAPLWGCFASLVIKHGVGASKIGGEGVSSSYSAWMLLLCFAVGLLIFALMEWVLRRKHLQESHASRPHAGCSHAHEGQEFLHFSGVLPHSFFDGLIWGLSLGFNVGLSYQVFLVLLIHRLIETSSWMSAFHNFKPLRFLGALLVLVGTFAAAAFLGSSIEFLPPEQRKVLMLLFVGSLGYLAAALFVELREQWAGLRGQHKIAWGFLLLLGFVAEQLILAPLLIALEN